MHGAVVCLIALIIGPATAMADWEFTRWGMTVNEVERASRYSAIMNGQGFGCLLEMPGPITFQGVRFDRVLFCFDDSTLLESVDLIADAKAYDSVERRLRSTYGPPQLGRSADLPERYWTDTELGDVIQLSRTEKTVVTYSQAPQSIR
jgi:hypothetical protein